jgi:ketosteroid isomerase-like protein
VLELTHIDLNQVAEALQDQSDYGHRWLIDPRSGEILFWTSDAGIDGDKPVDLDELDAVSIDPLPSYIWYEDMVDFAEQVSDERARRALGRALEGKGAFRRFRDVLHQDYEQLLPPWRDFQAARAHRRAVEWLVDRSLVEDGAGSRWLSEHPDPRPPAMLSPEEWIERYRRAWESGDADGLVALFTPEASYRSSVFTEPSVGHDAIRAYWQRGAGAQREVRVRMGTPIVGEDRVAVEWWTTMDDPDQGEITLPGCLLLRFESDGRCSDLWEYWQTRAGRLPTPADWGGIKD